MSRRIGDIGSGHIGGTAVRLLAAADEGGPADGGRRLQPGGPLSGVALTESEAAAQL
jgi:hypothetical protein